MQITTVGLSAARWAYIGSIDLIATPDLAARTIEPGELLAFVPGRLRQLFVHDRCELARRLAAMDDTRDPDGWFRWESLMVRMKDGETVRAVVNEQRRRADVAGQRHP